MIYTRNKESFKTKTVKTTSSVSSTSKLSQNGLNLVEELRQRLQNKNKKHEQTVMTESISNDQELERPRSSTPKKLTISKNFTNKNQQAELRRAADNQESFEKLKIKEMGSNPHANQPKVTIKQINNTQEPFNTSSNPFSKVKKDAFLQLANHNSIYNSQLGNSKRQDKAIEEQNEVEQQNEKGKEVCQSPIQGLNKSNYSSNNSSNIEAEASINSKQVYENQVKKWGKRVRENSREDSVRENEKNFNSFGQNEINKVTFSEPQRLKQLAIISKIVSLPLMSVRPQNSVISRSSAQQEYLQLLEGQIFQIKQEISQNLLQINELTNLSSQLSSSNGLLEKQNAQLKHSLFTVENQLAQFSESSFVIEKYERLFEKMRNLLIINAMQMIQTKNFLQINFGSSVNSSLNSSPQRSTSHSYYQTQVRSSMRTKSKALVDQSDCNSRIQSLNECLARIEQTIEVSQSVVSINKQRQILVDRKNTENRDKLEIKELSETINYKDKIIHKLKEQIVELKEKFSLNKSQFKPSSSSQVQNALQKPYSYVDQIHLLRHQINRLTQQNCLFYDKYSQLKTKQDEYENSRQTKDFPNKQRIVQIESLIKKLDKHQTDQLNNSKLQYWTKNKTHKPKQPSPQSSKHHTLNVSKNQEKLNTVMAHKEKPKQLDFTKPIEIAISSENLKETKKISPYQFPEQQRVIHHSKQRYSSDRKGQKIEYSKEDFSELVNQFKSTLSGLTPEKRPSFVHDQLGRPIYYESHKKTQTLDTFAQNDEVIELPTFRTPKQEKSQKREEKIANSSFQKQRNQNSEVKSSSGELIQQTDEDNQSGYIETISRLEYEKEFLASERQTLIKENEKLIERIKQLESSHQDQAFSLQKQQIYKLKFQNQQLVNRIVQAQDQLLRHQNSSPIKNLQTLSNGQLSTLKAREQQIQSLMRENMDLHKTIKTLETKSQQLTKNLQFTKNISNPKNSSESEEQLSYILAPSFEELFMFLKRLPNQKHEYHQILLNMIEGYERKISQLREENVMLKSKHKELQDMFGELKETLQKVGKYFGTQKSLSNNGKASDFTQDHNAIKLTAEIRKNLTKIDEVNETYFGQVITPGMHKNPNNSSSFSGTIKIFQSKINYYLMFLRSLIQGIGESDLELIESELSDYLKQLRTRIPTVLEREEYEESYQSSLNTSVVEETDFDHVYE